MKLITIINIASLGLAALSTIASGHVHAKEATLEGPVTTSLSVVVDVVGAVNGDAQHGRSLSLIDGVVDADLAALVGWGGASARLRGQVSSGQEPNIDVGSLRGIDNIEVSRQRTRLYEAWIEQALPDQLGSVRIGLYDINTEFYATDSSALLIAPPYGIGSELAATGSAGPSIYPSTALALRLKITRPSGLYWQVALLNAAAGSLGDPGGIETDFSEGALGLAQAGWKTESGSLAIGAWGYSRGQDDLEDLDASLRPIQRRAAGLYGLAEKPIGPIVLFLRGGVSDGRTSPFKASWQAGLLQAPALRSRPDSQVSAGLGQERLSDPYRNTGAAGGQRLAASETALELAYSDQIWRGFSIQPGLQIIDHPGGVADRGTVGVVSLRLKLEY